MLRSNSISRFSSLNLRQISSFDINFDLFNNKDKDKDNINNPHILSAIEYSIYNNIKLNYFTKKDKECKKLLLNFLLSING